MESPPRIAAELADERIALFRARLQAWFVANRRDLPWRATRDPYAIWISEAMLQQTRVEAVLPYYQRFLARLPTIAALAAATEDEVVALWSGLGYYRRARALRTAAREIVALHDGVFPRERAAVLALPGIGPYTAGAVLSIAFGLPEPLVDGNVARVFARLFALEAPLGSRALNDELWSLARRLVEARAEGSDPGEWNQALMELGAMICSPRKPRCLACPLASECLARGRGLIGSLPKPAPKKEPVDVALEIAVVRRGADVLLVRRPAKGRMAGMWELPTRELSCSDGDVPVLWPSEYPGAVDTNAELGSVTHGITHHRIRASIREGCVRETVGTEWRWVSHADLEGLALTGLARKVLKRAGFREADGLN